MEIGQSLIQLDGVTKVFVTDEVETHALAGIHIDIKKGEYVSIAGPSGCGKSTLLAILGLLDSPTEGTYVLNGKTVQNLKLSERAIVINSFSKYYCMTGWRIGWMVVPEALVRPIDRLHGNLAISVPTLSQIAAEAAFDGRAALDAIKHGYEDNRKILIEGLPKAGLSKFLPVDGAFYLYADVSEFSDDSFDFAKRLLEEAHVAATPGVDFDPIDGRHFVRFSYAGSTADMKEAVERIGAWLRKR